MSIFKASFPDFVQTELDTRQKRLSDPTKRHELAIYQSTRNAFIRMTSGVEVDGKPDLAKKYILQGGTLTQTSPGVDKIKSGVGKTFDSAYSINSATGNPYLRGMRPMPGITGMNAECKTAYGSLIEATVTFQCWDIRQLEDLELLFMRPGYTVLLEWGWAYNGRVPQFYDILSQSNVDFNKVNQELFNKCRDNKGNYEAILGYVKNYQWSARPDGGYDCTTYIISLGEVLESLKMNYAPLNINLNSNNSVGILKQVTYSNGEITKHSTANYEKIKDYYSKGILSGLLYETQLFMNANALYKTPDATLLNGAPYPDLIINGKKYHVFKKKWDFKNKDINNISSVSAVGDNFNYYITLESLCDLVNTYVLPQNQDTKGTKSSFIEVTTYDRNYQNPSGSLAEDLKCIAHPLQISTDPTKCLIKGDVWINGQAVGIQQPNSAVQGPTSTLVKEIFTFLPRTSQRRLNLKLFIEGYMKNSSTNSPIQDFQNALKKVREETINYIKFVGSDSYVLGVFDPTNPTNTVGDGTIKGKEVIFSSTQANQFGLNFLKFLEYKDIDELFKELTEYAQNVHLNKYGNKVAKDNFTNLFTTVNPQISNPNAPNGTIFILKKADDVNIKNILKQELDWQPLNYNNSTWGNFILGQKTAQVATATIVTAKEVLKGLGSLKEYFVTGSNYSSGHISNIYLDIDYLHSTLINQGLEQRDPQGKNTINITEFFKVICQTMQECTGNINNFDLHIDNRDNKARIVDLNITPDAKTSNLFSIELHNLKSTARSYKLESKIFPEQGAIIAISAQDFQSSGQLGYNNGTLTSYNRNITDRLKPRVVTPSYVEVDEKNYVEILLANFAQLQKYFGSLGGDVNSYQQPPSTATALSGRNVVNSTISKAANLNTKYAPGGFNNALRDMMGFFSSLIENPNRFSGIIPVTLSIDMDGFGGAVIGNLFKINEEILPAGYKFVGTGRQLGFLVKAFNHKLENNDWVTTIDAYPFIIPAPNDITPAADGFWSKFITEGLNLNTLTPFTRVANTTTNKTIPSGLVYPFTGDYTLTSPALETRISPTTGELQTHGGSDLAIPSGTSIVAVDDGIVIESAFEAQGAGSYIKISHTTGPLAGYTTIYMHLTKSLVKKGDKVKKSQAIGTSGNTGGSTGPHLHFEIRVTATQEKVKPNIFFPGF